MFGDPLAPSQCASLVRMLSRCRLPFQCAHGRPAVFPLVDLGLVGCNAVRPGSTSSGLPRPNLKRARERMLAGAAGAAAPPVPGSGGACAAEQAAGL